MRLQRIKLMQKRLADLQTEREEIISTRIKSIDARLKDIDTSIKEETAKRRTELLEHVKNHVDVFLLLAPEHDREYNGDCTDEETRDHLASTGCTRCMLLALKRDDWIDPSMAIRLVFDL